MRSKVKDQSSNSIELPTTADAAGNITAVMNSDLNITQLITAKSGTVAGSIIALPPGSLAIPISITIGEGSNLTNTSVTSQIGLSNNSTSAAGPSVSFIPSSPVSATNPFILSIPLSTTSLNLEDSSVNLENLIVIYKTTISINGSNTYAVGVLPKSELVIGKTAVQFQSSYFGTFQLAYSQTKIENKIDNETTTPPILKSDILPPSAITYNAATYSFSANTQITELIPTITGGKPDQYSVSPELPAGLVFNKLTGSISGTATSASLAQTFTITGSNEAGSINTSISIEVISSGGGAVNPPVTASVLSVSSTASDATYVAGQIIPITVTFSKIVVVTGTPQLTLATGPSNTTVNYTSGSGSTVLVFSYTTAAGDYSSDLDYISTSALVLNSASIVDDTNTAANLTLPTPGSVNSLSANKALFISANAAPTISTIAAQSTPQNSPLSSLSFIVNDSDSTLACSSTYLTMSSSNPAIVANASVTWSGSIPNCNATITPISNVVGSTVITITVTDVDFSHSLATSTFNLTVTGTLVLGQPSTTSNLNLENGMFQPGASVVAGGKLFVVDSQNNRVLVWNSVPTSTNQVPNFALGQPDLKSSFYNHGSAASASSLANPTGISACGTKLFVADSSNNRVLIWDPIPTEFAQNANMVLGQGSFSSSTANYGGVSATSMSFPTGLHCDGARLFVADSNNNRVLGWSSLTFNTPGTAADIVLGQSTFTGSSSGYTFMNSPRGVFSDASNVYVADAQNHRLLIWNSISTYIGQTPIRVLGQPSFSSGNPGNSLFNLNYPTDVKVINSKLFVADSANNRVLVWNSTPPSVDGTSANSVLGQTSPDLAAVNSGGLSLSSMYGPRFISSDGTHLFVSDTLNNRLSIWNSIPTSTAPAQLVLGQSSGTSNHPNNPATSALSLNGPTNVIKAGSKVIVSDSKNNRVLIWNQVPITSNQQADVVLGQANFTDTKENRGGSVTAASMAHPSGIASDGTNLFVADSLNSRILVWNSIPTTTGAAADLAIGQADTSSNTSGISSITLSNPLGVGICGSIVYVADSLNNRVLGWNGIPNASGAAANFVIGQQDFITNSFTTPSSQTLFNPSSVSCDTSHLFITDKYNHRVLVWNSLPYSINPFADLVIGQGTFATNTQNNANAVSAAGLNSPSKVFTFNNKVYVADTYNNRILIWDSIPSSSGVSATSLLGQSVFTSFSPNSGGLSATTLYGPAGIYNDGLSSFIADTENNRILIITN